MNRYQKHRANRTLARIKKHNPEKYQGIVQATAAAKSTPPVVTPVRKKG